MEEGRGGGTRRLQLVGGAVCFVVAMSNVLALLLYGIYSYIYSNVLLSEIIEGAAFQRMLYRATVAAAATEPTIGWHDDETQFSGGSGWNIRVVRYMVGGLHVAATMMKYCAFIGREAV